MLGTILQELVGDVRARYISCLTSRKWAGRMTRQTELMLGGHSLGRSDARSKKKWRANLPFFRLGPPK